ncbi:MAG TPA: fatty acid desaturase, partial [Bacteroidia bacterium]|nr:fatty acid desaturase [Bacteroidia bacterium]
MAKVTFNNKNSVFYDSIKTKVDAYFKEKNLKRTGNIHLFLKALILIPVAIGIYYTLLFVQIPAIPSLLLCAVLGLTLASIGFNVMHDACHGSYSSKKWVNELMGLSLNFLGGNAFIWKMKHNVIHHTYTNVDGVDDDIAKMPLIRQCSSQKWKPAHRYQHWYSLGIYALSSFLWVMVMDFVKYFSKKVYTTPINNIPVREHVIF